MCRRRICLRPVWQCDDHARFTGKTFLYGARYRSARQHRRLKLILFQLTPVLLLVAAR
ncbi:Uncharacterised protein [Vibrio cholerae]|uniref:Uncharacterized protein n=1 Tax=Vibrio cholerae TaxID=666 RepID=A0A655Z015_VIBCL|nr:Uncharacterised protein [Vibrio cholerae]CSI86298.1 Uncharacterised protein [Vibrio cholerae]